MLIKLSPVRMDEQLTLDREGDVLWLNGEQCDLGPLLEGKLCQPKPSLPNGSLARLTA